MHSRYCTVQSIATHELPYLGKQVIEEILYTDYNYATRAQLDETACRLTAPCNEYDVNSELVQCIRSMHFHTANLKLWLDAPWTNTWDGLDVQILTSLVAMQNLSWIFSPGGEAAHGIDGALGIALVIFSAMIIRGRDPVYEPLHNKLIPRLKQTWIDGDLTNRLQGATFGVWLVYVAAMGAMASRDESFFLEQCECLVNSCTVKIETFEHLTTLLNEFLWISSRLDQYIRDIWDRRPSAAWLLPTKRNTDNAFFFSGPGPSLGLSSNLVPVFGEGFDGSFGASTTRAGSDLMYPVPSRA